MAPTGVSDQWVRHKVAEPLPVALQGAAGAATCPSSLQVHTGITNIMRGACHALKPALDDCNSSEGREQIKVSAMEELAHIYYEQHGRRSHSRFAQVGMTVQCSKAKGENRWR